MEKQHKFSIWYVLLGIWVVLLIQNYLGSALAIKTIPYSQFLTLVKENRVAEVAISANQIQGKMRIDDKDPNKTELFKTLRVDPEISALLEQHSVSFKGQVESTVLRDLFSWIFPHLPFRWRLVLPHETHGRSASRVHDSWQKQSEDLHGE